jgi:hypothetical protein
VKQRPLYLGLKRSHSKIITAHKYAQAIDIKHKFVACGHCMHGFHGKRKSYFIHVAQAQRSAAQSTSFRICSARKRRPSSEANLSSWGTLSAGMRFFLIHSETACGRMPKRKATTVGPPKRLMMVEVFMVWHDSITYKPK